MEVVASWGCSSGREKWSHQHTDTVEAGECPAVREGAGRAREMAQDPGSAQHQRRVAG